MSMNKPIILNVFGLQYNTTVIKYKIQSNPSSNVGPAVPSPVGMDQTGSVNVTLGGAMVGGIILSVVAMCYRCHRGSRNRSSTNGLDSASSQNLRWRYGSTSLPLHIYTVESQQYFESEDLMENETNRRPSDLGPPPTYEDVVIDKRNSIVENSAAGIIGHELTEEENTDKIAPQDNNDMGLPSYEDAIKLGAVGHL